jgi:hypothetical protein
MARDTPLPWRLIAIAVLLVNAVGLGLALPVDFEGRPTKTLSGLIRWSDDAKYAYSMIGKSTLPCGPAFFGAGGNCGKHLNGKQAVATLTSVPTLYGEMYVATQIKSGDELLFSKTTQELKRSWLVVLALETNVALGTAIGIASVILAFQKRRRT